MLAGVVAALAGTAYVYHRGHAAGYAERELACSAEVDSLRSAAMEAVRQATALRESWRISADRAAEQLAQARERIVETERRANERIKSLASEHRRSLSAALVRVLNERTEISERAGGGDGAASGTATGTNAPPSAAAGDRVGYASERSVATWVLACRSGYDSCRAQLHGLQDWVREVTN